MVEHTTEAPDCAVRNGAHTAGPWYRDGGSGIRCDVRAASGRKVALCWGLSTSKAAQANSASYRAECDANARLIAAAPELALAASAAERKLVELRSLLADHGISCACTDEIVLLQDALIKAGV